jgi:beta-lactamase regulating signal transducer with metallopeptidase domain
MAEPDPTSIASAEPPQKTITPTVNSKPPPARIRFTWTQFKPYAIGLWLTGILLLGLRVAWSSFRLARAVRRLPTIDETRILRMLDACCAELDVRRRPAARQLPIGGGAPALVGFIRPTILLPTSIIASIGEAELRLILMHELAHVKRHDVLVNWLATCVAVLHWPNPAAWAVLWRMRTERELACDEVVLQTDGAGAAYARTIVGLVEAMSAGSGLPVLAEGAGGAGVFRGRVPSTSAVSPSGAVGILEGKAQLQRRLIMIAQFDAKGRRSLAIAASLGLIVGALSFSGATRAADPPAAGSPPPSGTIKVEKTTATIATESKPAAGTGSLGSGADAGVGSPPAPGVPTGPGAPPTPTLALTYTPAPPSPEEEKANARTAEKLKKPLQKVDFNGMGLRDATGVDILVEWSALEQAGIPRDAPVTVRLREPTPADALIPLMFRASGLPLRYEIDKGVVIIGPSATTRAAPAVTYVYDVADLVAGAPILPPPGSFAPGAERGGGSGLPGPIPADTSDAGALIRLIISTIEPGSWRDAGGELGSISFFKNKLVVKTSEPIHKEIASLLEMLREKPAGKEKGKPGY